MLNQLVKRDAEWRKLALQICGCPHNADDLVQEMYLKLSEYDKEVNTAYVYFAMKHLYLAKLKKSNKEVLIDDFSRITRIDDNYTTQDRYDLLDMVGDLHWFEREVLLITHEKSLRQAQEETGIHYTKLNYHKHKGLNKLKQKYGTTKRQKD